MNQSIAGKIGGPPHIAAPPDGLSDEAAGIWSDTLASYAFAPSELALLESALRSLDRAEVARAQVEDEGITVTTESSGAVRAHPAIRIENEARREFRLTLRVLGLVDPSGLEAT